MVMCPKCRFHLFLKRTIRRWCPLLFVFLGTLPALSAPPQRGSLLQPYWANRQPNIVFILADGLRYDDLGCYGGAIKTPHLDQLAAEGMRFTQGYAGSPDSAPSRATLLTGLDTGHARVRGPGEVTLLTNDVTVAEILRDAGYATGVIGEWGLGVASTPERHRLPKPDEMTVSLEEENQGIPTNQGFDEWLGFLNLQHAADSYPTQMWRNAEVLPLDKNFYNYRGLYAPDLLTRAATNFVRINKWQPSFLYLASTLPRAPHNDVGDVGPSRPALVARLDADVGKLMAAIVHLKLDTNTVVFLASDRSPRPERSESPDAQKQVEHSSEPASDLTEARLRVPMIVRWPGKIPAGKVTDQLCALWDFLPTALEIAGTNAPPGIDGISLLPTLRGQPQTTQHDFLYWECHRQTTQQAVRLKNWKAIRLAPNQPIALYDLKADPTETHNVAAQHPEVVNRMKQLLQQARTESKRWPLKNAREKTAAAAQPRVAASTR